MTPHRRPKIGLCDLTQTPSGVSRYVESILSGLDTEEFDVTLYCVRGGPYSTVTPHVKIVYIPETRGSEDVPQHEPTLETYLKTIVKSSWRNLAPGGMKLLAGFVNGARTLARLLRANQVDLLHTNHAGGHEEAAFAARMASIQQVVGTFHIEASRSRARDWIPELITNHSLHRAIAVSESTKRSWMRRTRVSGDRIETIHNGVNSAKLGRRSSRSSARERLGLPQDGGPIVGGVGRLCEQKGYSFLLEAVSRLSGNYPNLRVVLAGDGPLRSSLEQQANALNLSRRVHFLGHLTDVQDVYDAMDIFAIPSLWEAMPFALLDAMAAGLPTVGTEVAGVPEAIVSGRTGFVVPPRDPLALAAALKTQLDSPSLREEMGQAARARAGQYFDEATMINNTINVYRSLIYQKAFALV